MSHRAFAQAMDTKFCGSTMWKHSPSRRRLHRAAAILDDQVLHDLTTNDVYAVAVAGTQNPVAQGISIRPPLRND
jgi:replicative DNA helicase